MVRNAFARSCPGEPSPEGKHLHFAGAPSHIASFPRAQLQKYHQNSLRGSLRAMVGEQQLCVFVGHITQTYPKESGVSNPTTHGNHGHTHGCVAVSLVLRLYGFVNDQGAFDTAAARRLLPRFDCACAVQPCAVRYTCRNVGLADRLVGDVIRDHRGLQRCSGTAP